MRVRPLHHQPFAACRNLALLAILATAAAAHAQPFRLTADVNEVPAKDEGSSPGLTTVAGGIEYFAADDGLHGRELWRTDGTRGGTRLVKDVLPGQPGSSPSSLLAYGGALLFIAQREPYSCALWRSDGTDAGTTRLSPFFGCGFFFGDGAPTVLPPVVAAGQVYFASSDELWRSDGTPTGTARVKRIDGAFVRIDGLSAAGGRLFFYLDDGVHGYEPWTSDGTPDGTHLLADLSPGAGSTTVVTSPGPAFVDFRGRAFFIASPNGTNAGVWSSDGTESRTQPELDFFGQPEPSLWPDRPPRLVLADRGLFALVQVPTSTFPPSSAIELWYASESAFSRVHDFAYGAFRDQLAVAGDALYFPHLDEMGLRLWRSDGTPDGTHPFAEFEPGSFGRNPQRLRGIDGDLYFAATDAEHGEEAWSTDGTEAGTRLNADIHPGPIGSTPVWLSRDRAGEGDLLVSADDGVHGVEPHVVYAGGARLLRNVNDPSGRNHGAVSGTFSHLTPIGSAVLFRADDGTSRRSWRSDGSAEGTIPLFDTEPFFAGLDLVLGGSYYFTAATGVFATDGSATGLRRISERPLSVGGGYAPLTATLGQTHYFGAERQLWLLDASDDSLRSLANVEGGAQQFAVARDRVFFSTGYAVWTSDGTRPGTFLLKTFPPNPELPQYSRTHHMIGVGDRLFFAVDERVLWTSSGHTTAVEPSIDFVAQTGQRIWGLYPLRDGALVRGESAYFFTDGTVANTVELLDVGDATTSSSVAPIPLANGLLFFLYLPDTGWEPWFTDGTPAGTRILEVAPGAAGMNGWGIEQAPVRVDDDVYIAVGTSALTFELWRTDGTVEGTTLVREFEAGIAFGEYHLLGFSPVPNGLLLSPLTEESGRELWFTDGTRAGTRLLQDIAPGALSSSSSVYAAHHIAVTPRVVYTYADDTTTGLELWAARIEDLGLPCRGDCDGNSAVTVDELIGGVHARLSQASLPQCPLLDRDSSGTVSAAELRTAIRTALRGC